MGGRAIVRDVPGNVARVAGVLPNTQMTLAHFICKATGTKCTWRAQSPLVRGRSMVRMRVCVGDRRGVSLNRCRDRGSVLPWSCDLVRGDGDF